MLLRRSSRKWRGERIDLLAHGLRHNSLGERLCSHVTLSVLTVGRSVAQPGSAIREQGRGWPLTRTRGPTADGREVLMGTRRPDLLKLGGAKGIRTPALTRQNTD
jgi:hypothetical protein